MRLRFTVRRLLVLVAVVAFLLTGYLAVQWLRDRAWKVGLVARMESDSAEVYRGLADVPFTSEAKRKSYLKAAEWYDQRAALYRESIWRPWIEVPNVPEPSFQ